GGANKAIVEQFTAVADASGNITIQYVTVRDNAKSSGIEIISASAAGSKARIAQFGQDLGRIAQFFGNNPTYATWTAWATKMSHNTQALQAYLAQWASKTMTPRTLETLLGAHHASIRPSADWTDELLVQLQL